MIANRYTLDDFCRNAFRKHCEGSNPCTLMELSLVTAMTLNQHKVAPHHFEINEHPHLNTPSPFDTSPPLQILLRRCLYPRQIAVLGQISQLDGLANRVQGRAGDEILV
ncbi:hypothetical protein [Janthinobacterium sp. PSPC2-1]|uniref:hypothetical protein n=1 Tax=unclassified Janthinobacterium TaxID=2610881 RepID=UPI003CEC4772